MACQQIVVRGFGSFGGVEYLPTLGYGSSLVVYVGAASCRLVNVAAETRMIIVDAENRIVEVECP